MAECSYSRCVQQKRNIRRELQRWTKNMVHIVGLERIAEELMGRRKWKLYQESMSRNYLQPLNNNVKTRTNQEEYHKEYSGSDSEQTENKHNNYYHQVVRDITTITPRLTDVDGKAEIKENGTNRSNTPELDFRIQDWTPQGKCYFCVDGKLDSEHSSHGVLSPRHSESDSTDSHSDSETPTSLTPSFKLTNNHRPTPHHPSLPASMTTIESMAALAAALSAGNSPGTPTPHLPFYHGMLSQNLYFANVARTLQNERLTTADVDKSTGEQPLDLSKGASSGEKLPNHVRLPTLETKHIFKAKPRMSTVAGRRTYTEDELQAALRDIQSGKLGTRRAAVIYGIPRSTLRNKVYKLALERQRENHLNNSAPLKIEEEEVMDEEKELSGAEEEKEVEKALEAPLLTMSDIMMISKMDSVPDALKTMLQRNKEGPDAWTGMEHGEMTPYLQSLMMVSQKPPDMNQMEFVKRMMADEQLLKIHQKLNGDSDKMMRPILSGSEGKPEKTKSESDMETEESSSNVILKIPSFKPSKNGSDLFRSIEGAMMVSPPVSDSNSPPIMQPNKLTIKDVKDVIAQSISQKFQQTGVEPIRRPIMEMDYKRSDFTPPLATGISVIKTNPQDMSRAYSSTPNKSQQPPSGNSSSSSSGGKGTRPKRGKYRNYDRDSLVEAVRAVQRGEMSVHRAGSYYGVPHSTLEYKVKERHLMRPRKRDPKPNPVDEKIASLKQNDLMRGNPDKLKPVVMKPPQKFPPTSPNGMKLPMFEAAGMSALPGYNAPPPFPFWPHPSFHHIPLEYARNPSSSTPFTTNQEFFASQMMQKLQEDASRTLSERGGGGGGSQNSTPPSTTPTLAKSARQMAESLLDGTGSNGSFLDGIIRSSLESGVPNTEEKQLAKEEKNVAPENMSNKALLDQLCRNSRLTPLPKPNTIDNNSSGDESYRKGSSPLHFVTGTSIKEERMDDSSPSYERDTTDLHTIELSNDSHESSDKKHHQFSSDESKVPLTGRIYLKQDLVNPDNLKPEKLVRFLPDMDRNGVCENPDSASDNDAPQD